MSIPSFRVTEVPDGAYLLDVREDDEWRAGHIEGAVHVPMSGLVARADEVPKDRDVVVVCKVGARSAQVAAYLRQQGWENVRNLDGGVVAWVREGRALVSETGAEATVL
ncbi:MAG TPA: rhodanese-like domain-containing protein [Mycobacteriales bacterium]